MSNNIYQLGNRNKPKATPKNDNILVDQDPTHIERVFTAIELLFNYSNKLLPDMVEHLKLTKSHFIEMCDKDAANLPVLVLRNHLSFQQLKEQPTLGLRLFWKHTVAAVCAYFGDDKKITKKICDLLASYLMQIRLSMFLTRPSGGTLATDGNVGVDIYISEFGVLIALVIDGEVTFQEFFTDIDI